MSYNDLSKIKDELRKVTKKGFSYFFKNALLMIFIFILVFLFFNPDIIQNPKDFVEKFDTSSIWMIAIVFVMIIAIYKLSKSILEADRLITSETDKEKKDEQHKQLMDYRFDIGIRISNILKNFLIDFDANRACILEMHNGTNNLSGVPFIYADLNYDECTNDEDYAKDEFKAFNMTRYPFFTKHYRSGVWCGSMDELKKEDPMLYTKMKMVNCDYLCGMPIYGNKGHLGYLIVTFAKGAEIPPTEDIVVSMSTATQQIGNLLGNE